MSRRAFTLLELMVVVVIIVVLISLMQIALKAARELGYRTACLNNQHQIGFAVQNYGNSELGYLPFSNWDALDVKWVNAPGWLYKAPLAYNQATQTWNQPTDVETGALWPYLNSLKVYHCPMDLPPYRNVFAHPLSSYVFNGAVNGFGARVPSWRASQIKRSDAVLLWEVDECSPNPQLAYNDGATRPDSGVSRRHATGYNMTQFDGAAIYVTLSEFKREGQLSPGRFWCNPGTANGH